VGDEVFMIGRFMARDESGLNAPIARFGHLASSGVEIIKQDRGGFPQESFLVEVHSISGFSGSPIFVRIPTNRVKPIPNEQGGQLDSILRIMARGLEHQIFS
jgi:hypothetical protein